MAKRTPATLIVFWIVFVCGWASSANSSSNAQAAAEFHVSKEAESLATALFLFGNAIGALASGPISETAGRNPSYLMALGNWVTLILASFVFLITLLFLPETFSPMMLQWKAEVVRKETGEPRFKSQHELRDPLWTRLRGNITRPLIFFVQEPIVNFVGFYLTLIYVLVFTFLDGFIFIFVDTYGFSEGLRGTVFLAIAVGVILNVLTMPLFRRNYLKHLREAEEEQDVTGPDDEAVLEPEVRLWPAIFCAPLFPMSLFWMGWTN